MRGLKGKTAIVTGGAAGIGAAIVQRFEAEGTRVVVFDLQLTVTRLEPLHPAGQPVTGYKRGP